MKGAAWEDRSSLSGSSCEAATSPPRSVEREGETVRELFKSLNGALTVAAVAAVVVVIAKGAAVEFRVLSRAREPERGRQTVAAPRGCRDRGGGGRIARG